MAQQARQKVDEAPRDLETEIRMMLSAVARLAGRRGSHLVAAVLCGSEAQKVVKPGFDEMPVHGLLGDLGRRRVVGMLEALVRAGLIRRGDKRTVLLTLIGQAVMVGKRDPSPEVCEAVREAREANYHDHRDPTEQYSEDSPTICETLSLLRQGYGPREVADRRGLATSTIINHAMALAGHGKEFEIGDEHLDDELLDQLRDVAGDWEIGDELSPVREAVDREVEWSTLKWHLVELIRQ